MQDTKTQPGRGSKDEQNQVEEQPGPVDHLQLQAAKEPKTEHLETRQAKVKSDNLAFLSLRNGKSKRDDQRSKPG